MKLRQLEYLMKIVECGSITQAAQQLYISQPSLTKAISSLEEEYKIQILVRKARGVELTPQGRDFVYYARGVLSAVTALEHSSTSQQQPKTRLFVATQQLEFIYQLFVEAYKLNEGRSMYYNLVETDRNDVVRQILDGRADIGFAVRTTQDNCDFLWNIEARRIDVRVIAEGHCCVAVGPKNPLWSRESVQSEEVEVFPNIALDLEDAAKQAFWANYSHYTHINRRQLVFCNTVSASEKLLLDTNGVSFTSPWTKSCYKNTNIHLVPVEDDPDVQTLIWVRRAGEPLTPTEAFFVSRVYQLYGRDVPDDIQDMMAGFALQTAL